MVAKTDSSNIYKPPTRFAVVKKTLGTSKRFLNTLRWYKQTLRSSSNLLHDLLLTKRSLKVVQASYTIHCVHSGPSKLLKESLDALTRFKRTLLPSTSLLHALWKTKRTLPSSTSLLQPSYTTCCCQNGVSKVVQASYPICCFQSGPSDRLQAFYMLYGF